MKKMLLAAACGLSMLALAPVATAQSYTTTTNYGADRNWYANLGYTQFSADEIDVGGATVRLGYKFNPNFGVEGEASFGIDGDTADFLGTPVDIDLDDQFGVYAVGYLPLSPQFELLGRVGWVSIEAQGSVGGFSTGADDDGLAAGVGAQWMFTDGFGVRGEYTRLASDNDGVDAWTIAAVAKF